MSIVARKATIISQSSLLRALKTSFKDERGIRDWPDELTSKLDPTGRMLITICFPHNDGPDWRILALAKVNGSTDPVEVKFTLPGKFSYLLQEVELE